MKIAKIWNVLEYPLVAIPVVILWTYFCLFIIIPFVVNSNLQAPLNKGYRFYTS